ncbi:hypothetical protein EV702DRAFT_105839 [Suillus placidus]|uniref:Uncharacterized protein n=1 Tax=Suillus placidus TaxID=48579 RepID=A0A9P7CW26_9AGAM|nr:hypothetical protein EV702DRAFT_105839 [Suillus placidus]
MRSRTRRLRLSWIAWRKSTSIDTKNIPKSDYAMPSEDSTCTICDDSEGELPAMPLYFVTVATSLFIRTAMECHTYLKANRYVASALSRRRIQRHAYYALQARFGCPFQ